MARLATVILAVLIGGSTALVGCGGEEGGDSVGSPDATSDSSPLPVPELRTDVEMKAYRHAAGFTFQHPAKWEVKVGDDALVLVPNDAKRDAQGQPLELIVVGGQEAEGIARADDPQVLSFFDSQFPKLKRAGETGSLSTLVGPGAVLTYSNDTHATTIYVTLHNGIGVYLAHVSEKALAAAREPIARRMFSTFGWEKGKVDPDLVGVWRRNESSSSSVDSSGYVGASTTRVFRFAEDGRFAYGSNTRMFGHVSGGGGQVTLDPSESGGGESGGTWNVEGNRLTLLWSAGGIHTYEYSVFAHTEGRTALKLLVPGEKKPDFYIKQ